MCTRDHSFEDFATIFHEMGHIQYFMQYSDQPQVYRDGANNGFHEAIGPISNLLLTFLFPVFSGELMGLFSATPSHLYKLGLLDSLEEDEEMEINFLMSQALITITTLPFHLVNDLWSWKVFRGEVRVSDQKSALNRNPINPTNPTPSVYLTKLSTASLMSLTGTRSIGG